MKATIKNASTTALNGQRPGIGEGGGGWFQYILQTKNYFNSFICQWIHLLGKNTSGST